jgi:hypothetical protein
MAFCVMSMTACQFTGPTTIRVGRGIYNAAVQQTNNEQLLLNIVRLRYRDNPFFLEVASVSTNFTFEAAADASADLPSSAADTFGVGAGVGIAEEPTVTYTPLQGEQFVKQLLSPIDPALLLLLDHSGWSIERILRVCVQRLGGLPNAPSASGPTPEREPEYRSFLRLADLLRELELDGVLELGQSADPERPGLVLQIEPKALGRPEVREIEQILGRPLADGRLRLVPGRSTNEPDAAAVETRSLMAALFYVSQGVAAPLEHEEAGWVNVTQRADGERFDWTQVTGGLLQVESQRLRPRNAFVKTPYNGRWFYIDKADLDSKSTFLLLNQLFALQGGSVPGMTPVLTLPVSR